MKRLTLLMAAVLLLVTPTLVLAGKVSTKDFPAETTKDAGNLLITNINQEIAISSFSNNTLQKIQDSIAELRRELDSIRNIYTQTGISTKGFPASGWVNDGKILTSNLSKEIAISDFSTDDIKQLQESIKKLQNELSSLQNKYDELQSKHDDLNRKIAGYEQTVSRYRQENEAGVRALEQQVRDFIKNHN